jgi:hypothetical protein
MAKVFRVFLWLWLCFHFSFVDGLSDWQSCFEMSDNRTHVTTTPVFKTEAVSSEFIVKFAGFYVEATRRKYIDVALKSVDSSQYEVIHRNNPMAAYPSDFDLVVNVNKFGISIALRYTSV